MDGDVNDRVIFRWRPDDPGTGELSVDAAVNGYSGRSTAWIDEIDVRMFAAALLAYPLPDTEIELRTGFGASAEDLDQEHIDVTVAKVGVLGQIGVRIHLALPMWPQDRPDARHEVWLELLTTYERLTDWSKDLYQLLDGHNTEAVIGGEFLA